MNEQQLAKQKKALDESIEHWTRLATGTRNTGEGIFGDDCALCKVYHNVDYNDVKDLHCVGCPVYEATEAENCRGTPWFQVRAAHHNGYESEEFKAAAQKMLDFLLVIQQNYEKQTQQTAHIPTQDNTPSAQS